MDLKPGANFRRVEPSSCPPGNHDGNTRRFSRLPGFKRADFSCKIEIDFYFA
jgi:hypothetical protein